MTLDYDISDHSSKFLKPKGSNGLVDVINDFAWTLTPKSGRKNVPTAYISEYQQTAGQLIASIIYYSKVVQDISANGAGNILSGPKDASEIYKYKYFAKPTGFSYSLPYFSQKHTSRTSSFDYEDNQNPFEGVLSLGEEIVGFGRYAHNSGGFRDTLGTLFGSVPALFNAAVGVANTLVPGKFGLENPQSWKNTEEGTYQFTFDLFNTGSVEDIMNNRNLAYILKYQSSPSRRSFCLIDPICIYDVYIPDVTYLPAAYISDLTITNLGNTREVMLKGAKRIIPEAYRFSITFHSLFMPTRNILQGMDSGKNVQAITDSTNLDALLSAVSNGDFNKAYNLANQTDTQFGLPQGTIASTYIRPLDEAADEAGNIRK